MLRLFYDVIFFIFSLFYLPLFLIKGKWNRASLSRFGIISEETVERLKEKPVLWAHAVSVGEISLAVGFINRLRGDWPNAQFLITTTTPAGHEVAQKIKNEEDFLLYFPADFRWTVKAFLKKVSPAAVVLFETEIWPNLIFTLSEKKVPVLILNGRISDKAMKGYRRVRFFLRKVLERVSAIGVQDERMRERFIALGARPECVIRTGNLKFDWMPPASSSDGVSSLRRFCRRPSEFLWIAGSTHDGEEEKIFEIYSRLKTRHGHLRLLVAPRHLHRVTEIEKLAVKKGLPLRKISAQISDLAAAVSRDEIWLLNQMGVLASLYETADAVFVGGSLVPVGGHNLVEPAFFEKAIVFGAHMNNFLEMAKEFKGNQAALQVRDSEELSVELNSLIGDPARRMQLGKAARRLVLRHQGATDKSRELLMVYWQKSKERKLVSV